MSFPAADVRNLEDSVDFEYNRSKTDDELWDEEVVGTIVMVTDREAIYESPIGYDMHWKEQIKNFYSIFELAMWWITTEKKP